MVLDWTDPGPVERTVTAEFIQSDEARELRQIVPKAPPYDAGQGQFVVSAEPVTQRQLQVSLKNLEAALDTFLPAVLGLQKPVVTTSKSWDDLTHEILATQEDYAQQGKETWRRIWYGMGDASKVINPWIEVIPNEYGLAVVKTGVAIILKLASKSLEKREKISQAFEKIRDAINSANPSKGSFRSYPVVAAASDDLYKAIIDSVNDMIILTAKRDHFWRGFKKKQTERTQRPDVDSILQLMSEKTQVLKTALDTVRDESIETTSRATKYTAIKVAGISDQIHSQRVEIRDVKTIIEEQREMTKEQNKKIEEQSKILEKLWSRKQALAEAHVATASDEPSAEWKPWLLNKFIDVLISNQKDVHIQAITDRKPIRRSRCRRGALVNEAQFCEAIADPPVSELDIPDIDGFALQPDSDWDTVSMFRGDFNTRTQSRVQSLLQQVRFLDWMNGSYPDLLLVLANLPDTNMQHITAMSVLCATMVSGLINLGRGRVVLHFFCGLHANPQDLTPGPTGMVRSLIMQVFAYLRRRGLLSLDFLEDRADLKAIEDQDLEILCQTLQSLLDQFKAGTQVYCIIDSITLFESEDWAYDLETVLRYLQDITQDSQLPAIFKLLMTSPARCTPQLTDLLTEEARYPDRILTLSSEQSYVAGGMAECQMEHHLSQTSISSYSRGHRRRSDEDRRRLYEDDDYG